MLLGKRGLCTSTAILLAVAIATFGWSSMAAAESEESGVELQNYFSNAQITVAGNALVNITAPFEGNATSPNNAVKVGETCAMIYVFDTSQAMEECCGCPVTADGLLTLSITNNLADFPVGDAAAGINSLTDGSIRILASEPVTDLAYFGDSIPPWVNCDLSRSVCCDPAGSYNGFVRNVLDPYNELTAWGQHIQDTQMTETEFEVAPADLSDFSGLPVACAGLTSVGSGAGACTCPIETPTSGVIAKSK